MNRRELITAAAIAPLAALPVFAVAKSPAEEINECIERLIELCQQVAPDGYEVTQFHGGKLLSSRFGVIAKNGEETASMTPSRSMEWNIWV